MEPSRMWTVGAIVPLARGKCRAVLEICATAEYTLYYRSFGCRVDKDCKGAVFVNKTTGEVNPNLGATCQPCYGDGSGAFEAHHGCKRQESLASTLERVSPNMLLAPSEKSGTVNEIMANRIMPTPSPTTVGQFSPRICIGASENGGCYDGLKNGDETDFDCGGACTQCSDFKFCKKNGDCTSGK